MADIEKAIGHLEDAEATIMSWWQRIDTTNEDEDYVDVPFSSMLGAVLRSVSRAAGSLESRDNDD